MFDLSVLFNVNCKNYWGEVSLIEDFYAHGVVKNYMALPRIENYNVT